MKPTTLTFDIETHSASRLWDFPPRVFFRLGGYAWGDGEVVLTDDLEEMRSVLRRADRIVGHNIHAFDLTAIFGKDSLEPFHMALDGKIYDTWADLPVIEPYPALYENRHGTRVFINGVKSAMAYYGLAESAHRWGTASKVADLADMAREYGDPSLRGKERENDGYGKIPIDLPEFRDYLIGDVLASRELAEEMVRLVPWNDYRAREQKFHGVLAQCARNGIRINVAEARARLGILTARKNEHLALLEERYGLPTQGKQPLRTNAGKAAVLAALKEVGVEESDLPRTKTGKSPALGGKEIKATVEKVNARRPNDPRNDEAESLAESLAAISGARMTAQTFLDHLSTDGRCHPSITALQRSARISFQEPGLTVVGARGDGANDKKIIVASRGHKLVAFDFQAADSRIVAGYSGDEEFYEKFIKGDAHTLAAVALWGEMPPGPDGKHPRRQTAKMANHASAYRVGARTLSRNLGMTIEEAQRFLDDQKRRYPKRFRWQESTTRNGERRGWVENAWGRKLPVERDRAFTQATAQLGQNGTREMLVDILLRAPREVVRRLIGIVHDEVIFDWPEDKVAEYSQIISNAAVPFDPPGGLRVEFPLVAGKPGDNWLEAAH